jgi:hypothetical protein
MTWKKGKEEINDIYAVLWAMYHTQPTLLWIYTMCLHELRTQAHDFVLAARGSTERDRERVRIVASRRFVEVSTISKSSLSLQLAS